ncbi:Glucoside xylosyltransferase 2 [Armadillidium vulgare]|nr:Glucoside xylosyltransferase 2 [Armadillidium vulgare]
MIKSAAILTPNFINFIIVVNKDFLYASILREIRFWPEKLVKKFSIQKRYVKFPIGSAFKSLFRECAAARLFFPDQMPDIDKALYVDTDVIFLRPPEELWSEFNNFNQVQLSGFSPALTYYNPTQKAPYYGETGLDTGVWLMNFELLRNFPGGWMESCNKAYKDYKNYIEFGDQGIVNIIFNKVPQYVYELGCHWNFRFFLCKGGKNICNISDSKGIYLLHGCGMAFYMNRDSKIKAVYEVWKNFNPVSL